MKFTFQRRTQMLNKMDLSVEKAMEENNAGKDRGGNVSRVVKNGLIDEVTSEQR